MNEPVFMVSTNDLTPFFAMVMTIASSVSAVLLAWIAYKQATLTRFMRELERNTNSKMDQLVEEVRKASLAEGRLSQQQDDARRQEGT